MDTRKHSKMLTAAVLTAAAYGVMALGLSTSNSALAAEYTIDGTSDYTSGVAAGGNTPQLTITTSDYPITGSWNAGNGDKITISGGSLSISGYDGSTDALTNGIITATGGSVGVTGGTLTLNYGSQIGTGAALSVAQTAAVNIAGGTAYVTSADTVEGTLNLTGGTLDVNGITDGGTITATDGNLVVSGNTTLGTGSTIGTLNHTTIAENATLTIGGANVTIGGDSDTITGAINMASGNLSLNGVDTSTTQGITASSGTINVINNSVFNNANDNIGGSTNISVSSGKTLTISEDITTTGSLTNGGTVANSNNLTLGTIANTGTLNGTGNLVVATSGTNSGTISQADITLNNSNTEDIAFANTGTITSTGTFTNYADITGAGTLNVKDGITENAISQKTIKITGSFDSTEDGANITATDGLTLYGASALLSNGANSVSTGTLTINNASGKLTGTGALSVSNGGSNAGTIEEDSVTFTGGTFTNNATGRIVADTITNNLGSTVSNNNTITVSDTLTNNGTINNQAAAVEDAPIPTITAQNLVNAGTITSEGESADKQALITVDTLQNSVDDGQGNITNGKIDLTNTKLTIANQTEDIDGNINVIGTSANDKSEIAITGDSANFTGTLNVGQNSAGTSAPATLTLTAGNVVEDAIVNIASGGVLDVAAGQDAQSADLPTSLVLNSDDNYSGDLVLDKGDVTMKGVTYNTGDTSTTNGGTKPYYKQNGGALTLESATLDMADASKISGGDLTVDTASTFRSEANGFTVQNLNAAGTVDAINNARENYNIDTLTLGQNSQGVSDAIADFTTDIHARSNKIHSTDVYGSDNTTITAADGEEATANISDWQLNGDIYGWDAPIDREIALEDIIRGQVEDGVTINFTATDKETFTPIGWYRLNSSGKGKYSFDMTRFNPGVFRGQVTKIAQYQNQLMIDDMIFNHTMLDQGFKGNDYMSLGNTNRYASNGGGLYPPYQYSQKDGGLWVKMYGTFERLNMNRGLNVGNNAYGTIIGADFGLKDLRNDWKFMPTAYVAYNGAHQYWNGYGAYQNGGQLGFLGTWYKNDFMIGAMAYGGVYGNAMDTPRGTDDAFNYFAGGSVKGAYNWHFAKNWVLQPNLLVAYNFFGQENWRSEFGQMGMMSGMLHGVNIAPGANLIYERDTFSTYITLQYMYNINQSVGGRAGHVTLPHVHMDRGYIQYGIGVNKKFSDRCSGFFQVVFRNVGRRGVGLQGGFDWKIGKEPFKADMKGSTPELRASNLVLSNLK